MGLIKNYDSAPPSPDDKLIGTDSSDNNATKNFLISDIVNNISFSEYATASITLTDYVVGVDISDSNKTKRFLVSDLISLIPPTPPSAINLTYTQSSIDGILSANTGGSDATITLANGLYAGLMSPSDYTKLQGIEPGAQVNVNADWNATSGDAQILNKPTIVSSISATSPITSTGGSTPTISTSMATNKLIGRSSSGTGVMEEISVGTGLSLSGGTLSSTISGTIPHANTSGTDTYTATITGVSSYIDGDAYLIRFTNGNTTGCSLNINSLGAKNLYRNNDGLLIGGDIISGAEMLCVYNSTLNGFQCIGTSPNTLLAYVTNAESTTITKGQPVYAFSGTGDRMSVKLASNTSDATSAQTVGLVLSSSIAAGQKGIIIIQGLLDGLSTLPTGTFSDGNPIYLGATAGSITNVKPYAPNHLVYLGVVTTASPGAAGRMYVRVQNGYELDELHNVQAQSPSVNDVLYYFGGTPGQWKTASIPSVLGYTPVTNARTISTTSPLQGGGNLTADRTLSITQASSTTDGYISSSDWINFNGKQDALTLGDITEDTSSVLVLSGNYGAVIGSGVTIKVEEASSVKSGYLSSTDWTTFNGKQNALTNPVTGTGTANELAYFTGSTTIGSLTTATYPTLTELSYIKGVTSGIQSQLDAKQGALTLTTTGTSGAATLVGNTLNIPQYSGGGGSYTFSTGLTDSSGTVTSNLSTGISGGQSVIGGTASGNNLTLSSTSNATKGFIIMGSSRYDEANNRLGIQQTAPTSKLHINQNQNSVTQSDANGILLANSTAAINNTQSISPPLIFQGNGWSVGSSVSRDVRWRIDMLPVQASPDPQGSLRFSYSVNGAAYTVGATLGINQFLVENSIQSNNAVYSQGAVSAATQLLSVGTITSFSSYNTLNSGGFSRTPVLLVGQNPATAGNISYALDVTDGLVFIAGNGSLKIPRAGIQFTNLVNTAGSESGDLIFLTKPASPSNTAITERMRITSTGLVGINQTTPTSRLHINANQNSVTQNDANGILLANSTAATVGVQSISPAIVLQGNGWKTTATASSQDVRFRIDMIPVQGTSNPTGTFRIASSINGGAYVNTLEIQSNGLFSFKDAAGFATAELTNNSFRSSVISSGTQFIQSSSNTGILQYFTTTGGTTVLPSIWTGTNSSTAGDLGICINPSTTGGIIFTQTPTGSLFRKTAFASIAGVPTSNTANAEAGDLVFYTQSGGASASEKLRISSVGNLSFFDSGNFILGTTTGTKIGTSTSQKIGFWNATPIVQPTTGVTAATFSAGTGTAVNDASTFDGYTIGQIVKALRNLGLLA